jgi:hypothetical protein
MVSKGIIYANRAEPSMRIEPLSKIALISGMAAQVAA